MKNECGHSYKGNHCSMIEGHTSMHISLNERGFKVSEWPLTTTNNQEDIRTFGKVTSTKLPRFELIPKSTLEALATRLELGIERKGDGAWNALTLDKDETIIDKEFVIERLSHTIHHCFDAIRKIVKNDVFEGEEDSGAILFGGAVLAEYKKRIKG